MSTKQEREQQAKRPPDQQLTQFDTTSQVTKVDESIVALETALSKEIDARKEERFAWILALSIAIDFIAFQQIGWWQATLMFLAQLILWALLAKMLGVDRAVVLIEKLFSVLGEAVSKWNKPN
jgi:hypothetical protein